MTDEEYAAQIVAAKDALASLYQKTNGTMRTCRHYPDSVCTMRRCVRRGCQRAADILREGAER